VNWEIGGCIVFYQCFVHNLAGQESLLAEVDVEVDVDKQRPLHIVEAGIMNGTWYMIADSCERGQANFPIALISNKLIGEFSTRLTNIYLPPANG
jgi:hypothetical protein